MERGSAWRGLHVGGRPPTTEIRSTGGGYASYGMHSFLFRIVGHFLQCSCFTFSYIQVSHTNLSLD